MKDTDYRYLEDGESGRYGCRHKGLKDYAMAFAFGVGMGMGTMMFLYEKPLFLKAVSARQEAETKYYDIGPLHNIELSQKGYDTLLQGFKDIGRKRGWHDSRVWSNWCEILSKTGRQVYDGNVKKLLDEVNNPLSPMAKLLCKYRGPKEAPNPSQEDEERFEDIYQKYEQYQPTIDALLDENHDNELTREERNRGLYKLLHQ
jgi:hypothetical protein